jgi:hypothetical protein
MPTVKLLTATHIHALPGVHSVSEAECTRLCALGVAEPCAVVEIDAKELAEKVQQKAQEEPKKNTRKKAGK